MPGRDATRPTDYCKVCFIMAIFDGVVFHLSSSLSDERRAELKHVLLKGGAREAKSIHLATHVVTNTNKFEGCQDVEAQVAVITVCATCISMHSHLLIRNRTCGLNDPSSWTRCSHPHITRPTPP